MKFDEFKKVKEDAHSIHFRHPEGHEIKISKKAGLNLGQSPTSAPKMYANTQAQVGSDQDDAPVAPAASEADSSTPPPETDTLDTGGIGGFLSSIFGGAPNSPNSIPNPIPSAQTPEPSQTTLPVTEIKPQNYPVSAPQAQPGVQPVPTPDVDELQRNQQNVVAGIQGEAAARGAEGKAEQKIATDTANQLEASKAKFQKDYQDTQDEAQKAADDFNKQHIDSSQFEHHNNIGTAIGLILGGIGGALTHQGNPVQQYLQNQQEKWIQAQTINMDKQKNLMSFYTQKFGNIKDAQDMLRMIDNNVMAAKFKAAEANAVDPVQKMIAQQKYSEYLNQNVPINQQMQIRRQLLGQMNQQQPGSPTPDPAVASRFLSPDPETNKAALAEIKQQQNINAVNKEALEAFDRVANLQTLSNRLGSPAQSWKRIDAEWDPVIDKVTKNTEGRVVPITVELMSSLKPKWSDDAATKAEKREKFSELLNSERSTPTLDSIGVKVPKNVGVARSNANTMQGYQTARQ